MKKYTYIPLDEETVNILTDKIKRYLKDKSDVARDDIIEYTYELLETKKLSSYYHQEIINILPKVEPTISDDLKKKFFQIVEFFCGKHNNFSNYYQIELKFPEIEQQTHFRKKDSYRKFLIEYYEKGNYDDYLKNLKKLNAIPKKDDEFNDFKKNMTYNNFKLLVQECQYKKFSENDIRKIMMKNITNFIVSKNKDCIDELLADLIQVPFFAKTLLIRRNIEKTIYDFLQPVKDDIIAGMKNHPHTLKSILEHYDLLNEHDKLQENAREKFINYELAFKQIIHIYCASQWVAAIHHDNIVNYALDSRGKPNKIDVRLEEQAPEMLHKKPKKL